MVAICKPKIVAKLSSECAYFIIAVQRVAVALIKSRGGAESRRRKARFLSTGGRAFAQFRQQTT